MAILGLALGIGANVALFSVVNHRSTAAAVSPTGSTGAIELDEPADRPDAQSHLPMLGTSRCSSGNRCLALVLSAGNVFTLTGRGDPEQRTGLLALSVTLLLVAGLASYVPARRATLIDPMIALRAE